MSDGLDALREMYAEQIIEARERTQVPSHVEWTPIHEAVAHAVNCGPDGQDWLEARVFAVQVLEALRDEGHDVVPISVESDLVIVRRDDLSYVVERYNESTDRRIWQASRARLRVALSRTAPSDDSEATPSLPNWPDSALPIDK